MKWKVKSNGLASNRSAGWTCVTLEQEEGATGSTMELGEAGVTWGLGRRHAVLLWSPGSHSVDQLDLVTGLQAHAKQQHALIPLHTPQLRLVVWGMPCMYLQQPITPLKRGQLTEVCSRAAAVTAQELVDPSQPHRWATPATDNVWPCPPSLPYLEALRELHLCVIGHDPRTSQATYVVIS